jgi:hypothetical protein
VSLNTVPEEFQYQVGNKTSSLVTAPNAMTTFALPGDPTVLLPGDPTACGMDPAACVPDAAILCDGTPGCDARLVVLHYKQGNEQAYGLIDLETGAMVVLASTGLNTRLLLNLGDAVEPQVDEVLAGLTSAAASAGIDLQALLATEVLIRTQDSDGLTSEITFSLLEALQITRGFSQPAPAVNVDAPVTVGAGVIIHTYLFQAPCDAGYGYNVRASQLLPDLPPAPGALAALAPGGPVLNVAGTFPAPAPTIIPGLDGFSMHVNALDVTTDPDEPNGLPVWLPVMSAGAVNDRGIDFVGTGTVTTSTTNLGSLGCLGFGFLLGDGIALFGDNPLPIGLKDLPLLWDDQPDEVDTIIEAINTQVASLLANPQVQELLDLVTANLPAIPVPGV